MKGGVDWLSREKEKRKGRKGKGVCVCVCDERRGETGIYVTELKISL